ncbi:hypothetical protein PCA20602_05025 [Pandoraea capi]|uniref:Uncharacterized protein n=1 Tax=Pandoraea capi TaxID=2508286 RepID=A0ABY6WDD5_9BURK|nr:hypothetical protein [Pandoraea capi]VVE55517.1 hypothetical protein PCA20602_05025 [Pandoraea capi]
MATLEFNVRPSVVLPDHRPLFKITQLLLVLLLASRGRKSSLVRLQLFNWVLKEDVRREKLVRAAKSQEIDFPAWGLDPAVQKAMTLAAADGLITASAKMVALTNKGSAFCERALEEQLYDDDAAYLRGLKTSITEKMVDNIVEKWG